MNSLWESLEEFIYQNSPASNIGYALGLLTEFKYPTLFVYKYGPKVAKAMYNFIKKKPAAAVAVGGGAAGSGFSPKVPKLKNLKLKSEAAKKLEEAASTYQGQGMSRDAAKKVAKYNSPEFLDLVKNTYDKLTIKNSAGDIIATPSSRALSKELKLGVNFDFKRYNIPEQLSLTFSSNNKTYDAYVNAQKTANKTNKIVPGGKTNVQLFFPNATKEIQLLNQLKNKVFTGTNGQSKVTQRDVVNNLFGGEASKGEATLRSYLKNTSLTDDMAKALNIDSRLVGTKLNQIDAFHYKLPENLPSQSVVDRNAAIKAWKETAPQWQLDLWSEAKKTISKYNKFFPDDARALDHIAPFINSVNKIKTQHPKNWQILTRDDNNTLKQILF